MATVDALLPGSGAWAAGRHWLSLHDREAKIRGNCPRAKQLANLVQHFVDVFLVMLMEGESGE